MRKAALFTLLAGLAANPLGALFARMTGQHVDFDLMACLFATLFVIPPFAILALVMALAAKPLAARRGLSTALLATAAFGFVAQLVGQTYAWIELPTDAQAALLFVVDPVLAGVAMIVVAAIAIAVGALVDRARRAPPATA